MAEGHGGGGGMLLCHLVGWVWLGGGEVSMVWQADEGGVHTLGVAPSLQTRGHCPPLLFIVLSFVLQGVWMSMKCPFLCHHHLLTV